MKKFMGNTSKVQTGSGILPWLLSFAGFAILLGGLAAMQSECGVAGPNNPAALGTVNYLAPVQCNRFFSFDWWIMFFQLFVVLTVAFYLFSRKVHLARTMLVALLAIATTLLMLTANTWIRAFSGERDGALDLAGANNVTDKFRTRSKVAFAGAIIAAIGNLLLILILGMHDEKDYEGRKETYPIAATTGTHPHTTESTTATTYVPATGPTSYTPGSATGTGTHTTAQPVSSSAV